MNYQRDFCFEMYGRDIKRYDLIDEKEEIALSEGIRKGDSRALEKLVTSNLRFVIEVSKSFRGQGLSDCELVNEGNLGLIKAAKRYDRSRHDERFITYAVWWIRQGMITAINNTSRTVRIPVNYGSVIRKIRKERYLLEQERHEPVSYQEACIKMGIKYENLRSAFEPNQSFDKPISRREDAAELIEVFEDPDQEPADKAAEISSARDIIDNLLSEVSERDRTILKEYYGVRNNGDAHSATLEEIGQQIHMGKERVRQRKERALRVLRKKINGTELEYKVFFSLS